MSSNVNDSHKCEVENKVEQLIDVVENHTRTERHLEQHSEISSPKNIQHAEKVQKEREQEIEHLKNEIAHGDTYANNDFQNLKDNYDKTEEYMRYNSDHMTSENLGNMKEKQRHRKEQMDNLR